MSTENKIRSLRADEVEFRVAQITAKGCQLLVYKDSRCDKRILDDAFGIFGWQNSYTEIKNNLYCTISIWDDTKKQWISKQDCGVESFAEKEKGEASDAFKRACFNIGIGRELYTKIFIWVSCETYDTTKKTSTGKPIYALKNSFEKYHATKMVVDEESEKIIELEVSDSKNNVVFTYANGTGRTPIKSNTQKEEKPSPVKKTTPAVSKQDIDTLRERLSAIKYNMELFNITYGVEKLEDLTPEKFTEAKLEVNQIIRKLKSEKEREETENVGE